MRKVIFILISFLIMSCGKSEIVDNTKKENIKVVKTEELKVQTLTNVKSYNGEIKPFEEISIVTPTGGDVKGIYYKNGDLVKKGELILELTDAEVESNYYEAQGNLLKAKSNYSTKKISFEKYEKLFKKELISEEDYLNMKNLYETAQGELKIAEATYISAKDKFDRLKVVSKIDGIVTDLFVKNYEKIIENTKLLTVIDISKLEVSVAISGKDLESTKVGEEANIYIEELGRDYKGIISEINRSSDSDSKKYLVKILVDNKDGKILKGMYAKVNLKHGDLTGIYVPTKAIMIKDLYSYIAIIRDGQTIIYKVNPVVTLGDKQLIDFPEYQEGDRIVVEGQYLLNNNDKVKEY